MFTQVLVRETKIEFGQFELGIIGVKFDLGYQSRNWWISFDSNRGPVYGDFFIEDGGPNDIAYNEGVTNHDSENPFDFIARPNTYPEVPEPSTMLLLGSGLIGLQDMGGRNSLRSKSQYKIRGGKRQGHLALPFLFISFGNHRLLKQPTTADS